MKVNNYHKYMLSFLENLGTKEDGSKYKILMHTCCGPCFTIPHLYLKDKFDVTLYFNNSNIYPKEEYTRRLEELKTFINNLNEGIKLIVPPYDYDTYIKDFKGHEDDREGSTRCFICYEKRIRETFEYAKSHGYDFVGSVMSISRYKNAQKINEIGERLEKEFAPVKWLYADFKKDNGYEKSLVICDSLNMYRQDYCGCEFSFRRSYRSKKEENK